VCWQRTLIQPVIFPVETLKKCIYTSLFFKKVFFDTHHFCVKIKDVGEKSGLQEAATGNGKKAAYS